MKNYIATVGFILFAICIAGIHPLSAQTISAQPSGKPLLTFPIPELGNCASATDCKTYCDDATHRDACIAYAKQKGFYKPPITGPRTQGLLQAAMSALGCTSEETCKAACQLPENLEKCRALAQKAGLQEQIQKPPDNKVLERAKQILGCDSAQACKALCEQEVNREKCSAFAKEAGLGGGLKKVGPGGCTTEESCRAYCQAHPSECKLPAGAEHPMPSGAVRKGPGNCTTEETCRQYCQEHPLECGQYKKQMEQEKRQQRPLPSQAQGQMNKIEEFCRANPDKCPPRNQLQNRPLNQMPIRQQGELRDFKNTQQPPQNQIQPPMPEQQQQLPPPPPLQEEVKGISTSYSLLQRVIDYIFVQ